MQKCFDPDLRKILERNMINFGEPLPKDSNIKNYQKAFSALEGLSSKPVDIQGLADLHQKNQSRYTFTTDNFLKMIFIQYRLFAGLPVILLGETGCGKTSLINYLCDKILQQKLFTLTIHGKIKRKTITKFVKDAESVANSKNETVYIFFDEFNTAPKKCIMLLKSLFSDRLLNGEPVSPKIALIAAGNPYILRKNLENNENSEMNEPQAGITFDYGEREKDAETNTKIVYRVRPIPDSYFDNIYDYGKLNDKSEQSYITKMVQNSIISIKSLKNNEILFDDQTTDLFSSVLYESHRFIRENPNDKLVFVSLRDSSKVLHVLQWLLLNKIGDLLFPSEDPKEKTKKAMIVSLFICFGCRFNTPLRVKYFQLIDNFAEKYRKAFQKEPKRKGGAKEIIENTQENLIKELQINYQEQNIAYNQSLKENILLIFFCCYTQIPLFLVGKPGSSKSISIEILMQTLRPPKKTNQFLQKWELPALKPFYIQCSPIITAEGITRIFERARRYASTNSRDNLSTVILDEVALAEFSPDLPLKVLHFELEKADKKLLNSNSTNLGEEEPNISIISVSNWELDPSQTNRGIFLRRVDPNFNELATTATQILHSFDSKIPESFAKKLAKLYEHILRKQQKMDEQFTLDSNVNFNSMPFSQTAAANHSNNKNYFGLRDFYYFLKMIGLNFSKNRIPYDDPLMLFNSILRNFGSKPDILDPFEEIYQILDIHTSKIKFPTTLSLISQNLDLSIIDKTQPKFKNIQLPKSILNHPQKFSRHLMILTNNLSSLPIILSEIKNDYNILFGSSFAEDKKPFRIIQNLNKVEKAILSGQTIVICNNTQLYEPLYDLLNQNYIREGDRLFARISFGHITQNILINEKFRMIIITDKQRAYQTESPPILNRFEKQLVLPKDYITSEQMKNFYDQQIKKLTEIAQITNNQISKENMIINYHRDLLPSLSIKLQNQHQSGNIDQASKYWIRICKIGKMMQIADFISNDSNMKPKHKKFLESIWKEFKSHYFPDFKTLFRKEILPNKIKNTILLTYSSSAESKKLSLPHHYSQVSFDLSDYETDSDLKNDLKEKFYAKINSDKSVLVIHLSLSERESLELFYQTKYLVEDFVSQHFYEHNRNKEIQKIKSISARRSYPIQNHECYIIFVLHLASSISSDSFFYSFEDNWEFYYLDELEQKYGIDVISLQEEKADLKSIFIKIEKKFLDFISQIIASAISKFSDPTNINFKTDFDKIYNILTQNKEIQKMAFQKIQQMITEGSEKNMKIYQWNFQKILSNHNGKTSFASYFFDDFNLLLVNEKHVVKNIWNSIFSEYRVPYLNVFVQDHFRDSQFPFSFYIYSLIENFENISEEMPFLREIADKPLINLEIVKGNHSKSTIRKNAIKLLRKYLHDFILIVLGKDHFQDQITTTTEIDLFDLIQELEHKKIEKLPLRTIHKIYSERIKPYLKDIVLIKKQLHKFLSHESLKKDPNSQKSKKESLILSLLNNYSDTLQTILFAHKELEDKISVCESISYSNSYVRNLILMLIKYKSKHESQRSKILELSQKWNINLILRSFLICILIPLNQDAFIDKDTISQIFEEIILGLDENHEKKDPETLFFLIWNTLFSHVISRYYSPIMKSIDEIAKDLTPNDIYFCKKKHSPITRQEINDLPTKNCPFCEHPFEKLDMHFDKSKETLKKCQIQFQKLKSHISFFFQKFGSILLQQTLLDFSLKNEESGLFLKNFVNILLGKNSKFYIISTFSEFAIKGLTREIIVYSEKFPIFYKEFIAILDVFLSKAKSSSSSVLSKIGRSCLQVLIDQNEKEKEKQEILEKAIFQNEQSNENDYYSDYDNNNNLSLDNDDNNAQISVFHENPKKLLTKPFSFQSICNIFRFRKLIIDNPNKIIEKYGKFLKEKKEGKEWILFLCRSIYYNRGPIELYNFVFNFLTEFNNENFSILNKIRVFNPNFFPCDIHIPRIETKSLASIFQPYVSDSSITENTYKPSCEPARAAYNFREDFLQAIKDADLIRVSFHSLELVQALHFEPFFSFTSQPMRSNPDEESAQSNRKKLKNAIWPGVPPHPYYQLFLLDPNKWWKCPNNHPYLVDQCGIPKEVMKCPLCGEESGAVYHRELEGTERATEEVFLNYPGFLHSISMPDQQIVRSLSPVSYIILQIMTNSIALCFSSINTNFLRNFFLLIDPPVDKPSQMEKIPELLKRNIIISFSLLGGILKLSKEDSYLYYHLVLNKMADPKYSKFFGIKEIEDLQESSKRNEIEKIFNDMVTNEEASIREELENLNKKSKERRVLSSLLYSEVPWPFAPYQRHTYEQFMGFYYRDVSNITKFPIINFVNEKQKELTVFRFLPGYLKFTSFVISQLNGKISRKKAEEMTISQFLSQEKSKKQRDLIEKWYQDFETVWNLAWKDVRRMLTCRATPNFLSNFRMKKEVSIGTCLPGAENIFLCAPKLLEHIVEVHNDIMDQVGLSHSNEQKSQLQRSVPLSHSFVLKNESKNVGTLNFPIQLDSFDFSHFLSINMNDVIDFINDNQINQNLLQVLHDYLLEYLNFPLRYSKIDLKITDFIFNDDVNPKLHILDKGQWMQEKIPKSVWHEILQELEASNSMLQCMSLVNTLVFSCSNIPVDSVHVSNLPEKNLIQFSEENLQLKNSADFIQVKNGSKKFVSSIQLKHLKDLHENFVEYFFNPKQDVPKKFLHEIDQKQEKDLLDCKQFFPDLNTLLLIWKRFLIKLNESLNKLFTLKSVIVEMDTSNERENEVIDLIGNHFPPSILLRHSVSAYYFVSEWIPK
ncbi:hypothetical protein M0811_04787 [Anaeramoeba ignava]|uniref:RZ-type domain-containing protein n=1 Tax=Anaeramoeba ignava TaxID=1746090 RepID=A0A9Q0RFR5_ANAIG|nr:hypothetical protein M0811_04787 [Anaeramoeba ignava]